MTDRHDGTSHPRPEADGPECACPADSGIARFFDYYTGKSVAKGREPEFAGVSQRLRDALISIGATGRRVIELGCGPGGLLLSLVEAGAERATGIDLSPGSLDVARQRFEAAGLGDRVDLATGDAARVELAQHDWVILDRVICCYPDIDRLLSNAIPAARQLVAFSVPVSTGWRGTVARLLVAVDNAWNDWRGRPCPGFVHDIAVIEERLAAAGFRERLRGRQLLWHYAVFERAAETLEPHARMGTA